MTDLHELPRRILDDLDEAVIGKQELKRLLLVGMLAGGHVLIEGPPGTGKTTTARAFCQALGGVFKRIQFTPDMLPSDVTGFYIYRTDGDSRFVQGPLFANVILADELNRTTPRTQAALLESMQEGQVTVEGVTHRLPRPMMVIGEPVAVRWAGNLPADRGAERPFPAARMERHADSGRRAGDRGEHRSHRGEPGAAGGGTTGHPGPSS